MKRKRPNALRRRIRGTCCVYCGLSATTEDHFPPYVHASQGFLLPACRECNSFASDAHPESLIDRLEHVKHKILNRYSKYIAIPDWTEAELAKLDLELREMVRASIKFRGIIVARLDWDGLAYLATVDPDNYLTAASE